MCPETGHGMLRSGRCHHAGRQACHHALARTLERHEFPLGNASELEQILLHRRAHRGVGVVPGQLARHGLLVRVYPSLRRRSAGGYCARVYPTLVCRPGVWTLGNLGRAGYGGTLSFSSRMPYLGFSGRSLSRDGHCEPDLLSSSCSLCRRHLALLVRLLRRGHSPEPDLAERHRARSCEDERST